MSSPFLSGFARVLVSRLVKEGLVEIQDGTEERVALYVGNFLGAVPMGGSLISSLTKALIACPEVIELYADDEQLTAAVEALDSNPWQWRSG